MCAYTSRQERAEYVFNKYGKFLDGNVLDVGCGEAFLKKYVTGKYIGVDRTCNPDMIVDLEQGKIPFEDSSFDCVVCTDVLEHVDNIHEVFIELTRVTKKYVILSLPNNWNTVYGGILKGQRNSSHRYGLSASEPEDRHKWFFNCEEATKFVYGMAERTGMTVVKCDVCCPHRNEKTLKNLMKWLFTVVTRNEYNNLFSLSLWAVLEKKA